MIDVEHCNILKSVVLMTKLQPDLSENPFFCVDLSYFETEIFWQKRLGAEGG